MFASEGMKNNIKLFKMYDCYSVWFQGTHPSSSSFSVSQGVPTPGGSTDQGGCRFLNRYYFYSKDWEKHNLLLNSSKNRTTEVKWTPVFTEMLNFRVKKM